MTNQVQDQRHYLEPLFALRWRLVFKDGTSVQSKWNDDRLLASDFNRGDVAMATIDACQSKSKRITEVAYCRGDLFMEFRWLRAHAPIRSTTGQIHGLVLVSIPEVITLTIAGTAKVKKNGVTSPWKHVISSC